MQLHLASITLDRQSSADYNTSNRPTIRSIFAKKSESRAKQMYELIILSLLMRVPLNRYQLAKVVNDKLGPHAKLSNGTLYPLLARLEAAGLVAVEPESAGKSQERRSRLFHITEVGRQRFQQLMMDTSSYQANYQQAFLFKVSSLDLLPPAKRFYVLNHYITYCQAHILHFTTEAENLAQDLASVPFPQAFQERSALAIRHLIQHWESEAAWAMQVRDLCTHEMEQAGSAKPADAQPC
ncbi:PadR family transcriptional regulator [Ktedonosporobacter rubrisoli]|uniref:PadR family transcriptional regulator n=1 Tax=Ktedonosporobacter rubrisoli TaxID=2509675 RepID=A0A4P6JK54_KTERU|nr:PadR family transcriptional regulator [Ktedonosporobacter rubrisoli]QBD75342.1 PadR family transcriptional regulator [Ktedonosporobacter rubrisoli]